MNLRTWCDPIAGAWHGTNLLRLSWLTPSDFRSDGTFEVKSTSRDKGVLIIYSWSHEDKPHEGSLLIAFDEKKQEATAGWVDSWHQGGAVLQLRGTLSDSGVLDLKGTYPAPPDPDWGWRIVIESPDKGTVRMRMFNITPKGEEDLAVEASYAR